ncbi:DUF6090 family protein [Algoriphagus halophilus]|uniref:Uncharacterized protein n=1 Tax=Algoriphagus halophilus TaxID=226505 RepID=A0A1N6G1H6_9BACT|nr:DUF6090 family protein [Algoriphagus halophilus]SIO01327.1 hypothetical protein SAMN05444394_2893 [Algoriphagus halophilus]
MKRIFTTLKEKWPEYILEILVITIGILGAFALNNWNEQKKDNIRKALLLNALTQEFQSNLSQLNEVIFYDELVSKNSLRLLLLEEKDMELIPEDTMRFLLQNSSWIWTFDSRSGALRSGISSGNIHLIQNDSLVNLLFSWQDIVSDANENESWSLDHRMNKDFVIEKYVPKVTYRSFKNKEMGASKHPANYKKLILDPEFETYISERYSHMNDALKELHQVKALNILILQLIENELKN